MSHRLRRWMRPLACLMLPSFLGAQVLAPVQLVGTAVRTGAERASGALIDVGTAAAHTASTAVSVAGSGATRELSDAGRNVLQATRGDGATGVARMGRRAVRAAPGIHQATSYSAAQVRLAHAQRSAAAGRETLAQLGTVKASGPFAPSQKKATLSPVPTVPQRTTAGQVLHVAGGTASRAPGLAKTGIQGMALAQFAARSPMANQFRAPFHPSNIAFAVAATAGFHILHQLRDSDQGLDLGAAFGFLGDKGFWGGMVGSGLGYSLATVIATAMIPVGGGLLAALGPLAIGMVGSTIGWQIGSALFSGQGLRAGFEALAPGRLLGQAGGTTLGLLLGANLAGTIAGPAGAILGAGGAVAGALLLGTIGAKIGGSFDESISTGDPDQIFASVDQAQGSLATIQGGVNTDYDALRRALVAGNNVEALAQIQRLQANQAALQQALVLSR